MIRVVAVNHLVRSETIIQSRHGIAPRSLWLCRLLVAKVEGFVNSEAATVGAMAPRALRYFSVEQMLILC
jgi:hypothetical protein